MKNNVISNYTNLKNITNAELLIYTRHHRRALARAIYYTCAIYFLLYLLIQILEYLNAYN